MGLSGNQGWNDSPMGHQTEKFLAAGVATIRRKAKEALQSNQRASLDSFPSDVLKIEIPATRAVDEAHEGDRDRPGMKPKVARPAAPGPQAYHRCEKVGDATAMGTQAIPTTALRADHLAELSPDTAGQHNENQLPRQ